MSRDVQVCILNPWFRINDWFFLSKSNGLDILGWLAQLSLSIYLPLFVLCKLSFVNINIFFICPLEILKSVPSLSFCANFISFRCLLNNFSFSLFLSFYFSYLSLPLNHFSLTHTLFLPTSRFISLITIHFTLLPCLLRSLRAYSLYQPSSHSVLPCKRLPNYFGNFRHSPSSSSSTQSDTCLTFNMAAAREQQWSDLPFGDRLSSSSLAMPTARGDSPSSLLSSRPSPSYRHRFLTVITTTSTNITDNRLQRSGSICW